MVDLNQFERRIVHDRLEFFVSVSVEVGFLDDDIFFQQESFEHQLHVEFGELGSRTPRATLSKSQNNARLLFDAVILLIPVFLQSL